MIIIKKKEFKKLYDLACDPWKEKLTKLLAKDLFNEEISFEESFVKEMQNSCNDAQLKVFKVIFKNHLPKEIEIDSLDDVYKILGVKESSFIPYKCPKTKEEKSINAQARLFKIVEAYNGGVKLDFKNSNQSKWYIYKYWSGGSWVVDFYYGACYRLFQPDGLHFVSKEKVEDAYKKFQSVIDEWLMIE